MGKRRLAYMVRRFHDGIYVLLTVEGGGGLIHELERRLRVTEPVIKFITVRIDEEQKRLDKIKAIRDARRKTPPPAPARPRRRKLAEKHLRQRHKTVVGRRSLAVSSWRTRNRRMTAASDLEANDQGPTTNDRF